VGGGSLGPVEPPYPRGAIPMAAPDYASDDWLLKILNHKDHLWLVQGSHKGAVVNCLRDALQRGHQFSAQGNTVISITRLGGDEVKIFSVQIYRLWKRIGPAVR
jgi:hypothetical protein